jgi:hypothetical protein
MDFHDPEDAINDVAQTITHLNLADLWLKSSALSCLEYFNADMEGSNLLFPVLNFPRIAMLDKAILLSNARDSKQEVLTGEIFEKINNNLINATNLKSILTHKLSGDELLLSALGPMANFQFPFQNVN